MTTIMISPITLRKPAKVGLPYLGSHLKCFINVPAIILTVITMTILITITIITLIIVISSIHFVAL